MNPTLPDLIDLRAFVHQMRGERFRSFVLWGAAVGNKSNFAQQLAILEGGEWVDVLALVSGDSALSARVDELDEAWLCDLALKTAASGAPLVVMDGWDFLIPVWNDDVSTLLQRVQQLRIPSSSVVMWVLHARGEVEDFPMLRADGQTRVLNFENIAAL